MHAKYAILIWTLQLQCILCFIKPIKSIRNIKLKKIRRIRWDIKFFEKLTFGNLISSCRKYFLSDVAQIFICKSKANWIKRKYKKMWPPCWDLIFLIFSYFIFVFWWLWWLWQQGFKIAQIGDESTRGSSPVVKQGYDRYDIRQSMQSTDIIDLFCQLLTKNQMLSYFLKILKI